MSQEISQEDEKLLAKLYFSDKDFDKDMNLINKDAKDKTIILFYSPMCGHCVRMKPEYIKLAKAALNGDFGNDVSVSAVNTSDERDLMQRIHAPDMINEREYIVMGVPTIVSYYKGQYYSTYSADTDEEKKKNFRKLPDLIEYIQGIGSAPVTYVERR